MSKLYFKYGAMNCGKTTHLLQTAHNYKEQDMNVLIVKPAIDTKGGDKIVSRLGVEKKVNILINPKENIFDKINKLIKEDNKIHCILVDEVQFLKEEQINQLLEIVTFLDIPVICYGLRTDFQGKGFEGSQRLLLIAHSLQELKNVCKCGTKATFNARKINGKYIFEGNQVAIDKEDKVEYEPMCSCCYLSLKTI